MLRAGLLSSHHDVNYCTSVLSGVLLQLLMRQSTVVSLADLTMRFDGVEAEQSCVQLVDQWAEHSSLGWPGVSEE